MLLVQVWAGLTEDEPTGAGCRLTWTFAFAPRRGFATLVKLGLPLIVWLLGSLVTDTRRAFSGQRHRDS